MKQVIRLTEGDLHRIVENAVMQTIMENDEDESWLGDKFRQGRRAVSSFMGNNSAGNSAANYGQTQPTYNLRQRFNSARTGWNEQGRMNGNNSNIEVLNQLAQRYGQNATIGQILNSLTMSNRGANGRISQASNRIYQ